MSGSRLLTWPQFQERAKGIRLLVLDVDGVLTNGQITYTESGEELKHFNVKDGQGINFWNQKEGRHTAIITARQSNIVLKRATELGIEHVFQKEKKKLERLNALVQTLGIPMTSVAYMGDDWPDMECLAQVGLATCPLNAVPEVQQLSHWVAPVNGGDGAVRALVQHLLDGQGLLPVLPVLPLPPEDSEPQEPVLP